MMRKEMVLISMPLDELETLIIDSVNACLNVHQRKVQPPGLVTLPPDPEQRLSKKEAANLLNVSTSTIDNYRRAGVLKSTKIGKAVRFRRADVLAIASPKSRDQ